MSVKVLERLAAECRSLKTGESKMSTLTLRELYELRKAKLLLTRPEVGKKNRGNSGDHSRTEIKRLVDNFDAQRFAAEPMGFGLNANGKLEIYDGHKRGGYTMDAIPDFKIATYCDQIIDIKLAHYDQIDEFYAYSNDGKPMSNGDFLTDPVFAGYRFINEMFGYKALTSVQKNSRKARKLVQFALAIDKAIEINSINVDGGDWSTDCVFKFQDIVLEEKRARLLIANTKEPVLSNKEYTKTITMAFGEWMTDVWQPTATMVAQDKGSDKKNKKILNTFLNSTLGLLMILMVDFVNHEKDKVLFNPGRKKNPTVDGLAKSAANKLAGFVNDLSETVKFRAIVDQICSHPGKNDEVKLLEDLSEYFGNNISKITNKSVKKNSSNDANNQQRSL